MRSRWLQDEGSPSHGTSNTQTTGMRFPEPVHMLDIQGITSVLITIIYMLAVSDVAHLDP